MVSVVTCEVPWGKSRSKPAVLSKEATLALMETGWRQSDGSQRRQRDS